MVSILTVYGVGTGNMVILRGRVKGKSFLAGLDKAAAIVISDAARKEESPYGLKYQGGRNGTSQEA
jgi:hypothetical protein